MRRALRLFFIFYAVAMFGALIGHYVVEPDKLSTLWMFSGFSATWCAMLALAFVLSKEPERISARFWMVAMVVVSASCLTTAFAGSSASDRWTFAIFALLILPFLGSMAFLLRKPSTRFKSGRIVLPVLWAIGAALVIASLFLPITRSDSTGLEVLRLHEHWITYYFSVGNSYGDPEIPWLQPIFGRVGYVFYFFSLILTATSLVSLVSWRLSPTRMVRSPRLLLLAGAIYVANFWLLVDIYWGWHFILSAYSWTAALGAMCWLAALLFAVVLAVKICRGEADAAMIRTSLLFQFPLALLNLLMLHTFFREDYLGVRGLGCLILGLQIQTYVLLAVTMASIPDKSPSFEVPLGATTLEPPVQHAGSQR